MNEHDEHDEHDERLRARLRAVDPASSLAPADPRRVARLLEDAMTETETGTETHERRRTSPAWWAAAAAVVVGGVALAAALGTGGDGDPTEGEVPAARSAVLTLEAPGATVGRCMMPNADALAAQEVAFLGVVEEVGDDAVTLAVEETYTGPEASTAEVAAPSDGPSPTVGEVGFREGERYLVSATDGQVTVCGFSGPATPQLQSLYDEAFGG